MKHPHTSNSHGSVSFLRGTNYVFVQNPVVVCFVIGFIAKFETSIYTPASGLNPEAIRRLLNGSANKIRDSFKKR